MAAHSNKLLKALSAESLHHLGHLEKVNLDVRQVIEAPNELIPFVYFVESGLVSVVGVSKTQRIEVQMIGYEGMSGVAIVLGSEQAACEALVQSAGTAMRVSALRLRETMVKSPQASAVFLRYAHVLMTQSSQTALANGRGLLTERLARWILMWQDRLQKDNLVVTHEFLALLLGVRRPGVTVSLHVLEGQKLIRASRTLITILDRPALQLAAAGYYGIPEAEYDRAWPITPLPALSAA